MICRNCNYILSGSEQFCPHCGASLPANAKENYDKASPPDIFTKEKSRDTDEIKQPSNRIFLSPDEIPTEYESSSSGSAKKAAVIVSLCLLLVLLCGAAFFITQKLDISPVISALSPTEQQTTTTAPATTRTAVLPENFGVIAPDLSYKPLNCYVTSKTAIPLKKGPDDAYATVTRVNAGEQLQIIGGCILNEHQLYVYYPAKDCYGWIEAAFLTPVQSLEELTLTTQEADETKESTQQETTSPGE